MARSFRAYFQSRNDDRNGDCGEKLGWWYAGCAAGSIIPCLGYISGLAALVMLVMLLLKFSALKNQVTDGATPPPM